MRTLSVKLPAGLHAGLSGEARRRNVPRSTLAREFIAAGLSGSGAESPSNCADLAGSLVGAFRSGRSDLSTDPELLAEAVVADARRGRAHGHR